MCDLTSEITFDPNAPLAETRSRGSAKRLLALYEIGRLLLEQRRPEQIVETILGALVEQLKPDHACILSLMAPDSLSPIATHNLDLKPPEREWPISRTALECVRESGLAILATDVLDDPKFETSKSAQKYRIRSVIATPLGSDALEGFVYLDRRSKKPPFSEDDLRFPTAVSAYAALVINRAAEYQRASDALKLSDERLEKLQSELLRYQIIGRSPALLAAYDRLRRLAQAGARVLLRGETGTGKELFARAYAASSERNRRPYLPVPVPTLSPSLIESELFGHVRGAFTAAGKDKKGRLELADGGVLFLDEIGDIELSLQTKLLRFLDSGELYRVGDNQPRRVDALIVSATNRELEKMVEEEQFRGDLLARLGHVVHIPPLRERPDDVPLLVDHFASLHGQRSGKKTFTPEAMELLKSYRWEFNVRQLHQVVEQMMYLVDHDVIQPGDLPDFIRGDRLSVSSKEASAPTAVAEPAGRFRSMRKVVAEAEKAHIVRTLEHTKGNRREAIRHLEISSYTFYKRLEEFGLHKKNS